MSDPQNETEETPELAAHPPRGLRFVDPRKLNLKEEMLSLNRVAKVVKGGRRFSFAAMMAVGDGNGHVGIGFGKANEVPDAIQKAIEHARKHVVRVALEGRTIPHTVIGKHDSARVLLRPASEGTGLIAGSAVRRYLALAGVHDILAKSLGASNVINVIRAVEQGLLSLKRVDEIARLRGKRMEQLVGVKRARKFLQTQAAILASTEPEQARAMREAALNVGVRATAAAVSTGAEIQDTLPADGGHGAV